MNVVVRVGTYKMYFHGVGDLFTIVASARTSYGRVVFFGRNVVRVRVRLWRFVPTIGGRYLYNVLPIGDEQRSQGF